MGNGSSLYLDFAQKNANFQILIDGSSPDVGDLNNCTDSGPIKLSATTAEIEIVVIGFLSGESVGGNDREWFFEFTNFMYALAILSWQSD